jgi:hypothetical protein
MRIGKHCSVCHCYYIHSVETLVENLTYKLRRKCSDMLGNFPCKVRKLSIIAPSCLHEWMGGGEMRIRSRVLTRFIQNDQNVPVW